jgi:sec-independent protein translocase protein TatA
MGIGPTEWIVIILVLVLLFGARKIPELAQGLGKGIREFKKAAREIDEEPPKTQSKSDEEKKG